MEWSLLDASEAAKFHKELWSTHVSMQKFLPNLR